MYSQRLIMLLSSSIMLNSACLLYTAVYSKQAKFENFYRQVSSMFLFF